MKIFHQILTTICIAALLPSLVVFFTLVHFERHHRTSNALKLAQNEEVFSGNIEGDPSGLIVVYDLDTGDVRRSSAPTIDNVYNSFLLVRSPLPSNGKAVKVNFGGNSYEGICRPIRNGQLGECRLVHEELLGDAVTSMTRIVIGIILFSAVAAIIMAYRLSVRISGPVESLSRCIHSMPENDYKVDYLIKGNSEFDELAQQLKSMCSKINECNSEIANKSRQAAIGQMSSHIAHDMRSPLSVLKAYVGLEGNISAEKSGEYRAAAAHSVAKLLRMADGLIDYTKADKIERSIVGKSEKGRESTREAAKRFLVVDDDEDMRRQWKQIIDKNGGQLLYSAASVEEVQRNKNIDYSRIDTAVVDYRYEGFQLTGIDLIEFLKQKGVREIHLCTGFHKDDEIRRRAAEAGADSIIPKPIDEGGVSGLF